MKCRLEIVNWDVEIDSALWIGGQKQTREAFAQRLTESKEAIFAASHVMSPEQRTEIIAKLQTIREELQSYDAKKAADAAALQSFKEDLDGIAF